MSNFTLGIIRENEFIQPRFIKHVLYAKYCAGCWWMGRCRTVSSQSPKAVGVRVVYKRSQFLYKPYYFLNLDMAGLEFLSSWNGIPKDCLFNDSRELVSMLIP